MIKYCFYFETSKTDPYRNLALEEHLFSMLPQEAILLYLWQNEHTVVIGKNQNAFKEVNVTSLLKDGGHLCRRPSGGGAVYHDLGNLNFTFIMPKRDYDVARQMQVLVEAAKTYGLKAELSGRNDALIDGHKFSGNAYYHSGDRAMHHGTVLIDTDLNALSKYLNVSHKKLEAKGVASVKSRVCNLKELNKSVTVAGMKQSLKAAMGKVYGLELEPLDAQLINPDVIDAIEKRISAYDYVMGKQIDFTFEREAYFPWGMVDLQLKCENGVVKDVRVYSDAMAQDVIARVQGALHGARVSYADFKAALTPLNASITADILTLLEGDGDGL